MRRRGARLAAVAAGLILFAPALPIAALRWVDPPVTAFMLRTHFHSDGQGPSIHYIWRDLERISPHLALAVVAAEDQTFPEHHGFVWSAIGDAIEENADGGRLRGASSITQQVAKNLFLWPARSFLRKGVEAYLTVWIELLWPKHRILEVYLNVAQFGDRVYGAEAAARRFFEREAVALDPRQAAYLAAVLPAPTRYRAFPPSDYVRARADWVLAQMGRLGPEHVAPLLDGQK